MPHCHHPIFGWTADQAKRNSSREGRKRASQVKNAGWPIAINVNISFEEAMRLHLRLSQILGKLNGYNRATTSGRRSGVNLCVFTGKQRITINEGSVRDKG